MARVEAFSLCEQQLHTDVFRMLLVEQETQRVAAQLCLSLLSLPYIPAWPQ